MAARDGDDDHVLLAEEGTLRLLRLSDGATVRVVTTLPAIAYSLAWIESTIYYGSDEDGIYVLEDWKKFDRIPWPGETGLFTINRRTRQVHCLSDRKLYRLGPNHQWTLVHDNPVGCTIAPVVNDGRFFLAKGAVSEGKGWWRGALDATYAQHAWCSPSDRAFVVVGGYPDTVVTRDGGENWSISEGVEMAAPLAGFEHLGRRILFVAGRTGRVHLGRERPSRELQVSTDDARTFARTAKPSGSVSAMQVVGAKLVLSDWNRAVHVAEIRP